MNPWAISAFAIFLAAGAPAALCAEPEHPDQTPSHGGAMAAPQHHDAISAGASRPAASASHHHPTLRTHAALRTHHRSPTSHRAVHLATHATAAPRARIDIAAYHRNITAERRFHFGDYRAPPGYAYRRWSFGNRLPAEYFARGFWITNSLNFGLEAAPDGYVWVRYGPDALLIDEGTGEILQVEYGLFY